MIDICERLRRASGFALMSAARQTLRDAADEIERLRAEVDKAFATMNVCIREHSEMRMLCANGRYLTDAEVAALELARAALAGRGCHATADAVRAVADRYGAARVEGAK